MTTIQAVEPEPPRSQALGSFHLVLLAVGITLVAWCANHLNILRAQLHPPPGTQPLWTAREMDMAQYLTWANGMRDALVIPNYHMPAVTRPALFNPLLGIVGQGTKLGLDASAAYAVCEVFATLSGIYCILVCLRLFLASRREYGVAILLLLGAVPLMSVLNVWRALHGEEGAPLFFVGDGLFMAWALTRLVGTASVYATLILVTRYALTGTRKYLYFAAAVGFVSGLCHPFEIFTIMLATALTFVVLRWPDWRRAVAESLILIVPGVLGLLPYFYFSLTVPWMRQITANNVYKIPDLLHLLGILGVPTAFVLLNMVFGPRLRGTRDVVLQCWVVAALVVMHVPRMPWALHAADGLCFVAAILAVRQAAEIPYLRSFVRVHPRVVALAIATLAVAAIFVHGSVRYLLFRDGIKLESPFGLSAVSSQAEHDLIRWFRKNGTVDDLVMVPNRETSWMLATAPVHTLASHWLFSLTYSKQAELRNSFYRGEFHDDKAREFLREKGVDYVVVPEGSPIHQILDAYPKVAQFPPFTLYRIPGNHMPDHLETPE